MVPQYSPDGRWWWDGYTWRPAFTSDGRSWFDGRYWRTVAVRSPRPRWVLPLAGVWLSALSAWEITAWVSVAAGAKIDASWVLVIALLAAAGVLATVSWGFCLARYRRWADLAISAVVGAGVLLGWYVAAMISLAQPGEAADNEAGAGVAIFSLPALASVSILLGIGFFVEFAARGIQRMVR